MSRRLFCCSYHCLLDPSSGAALSMRDMVSLIQKRGWEARALCGPVLDYEERRPVAVHLSSLGLSVKSQHYSDAPAEFDLLQTTCRGLPVSVYSPPRVSNPPDIAEAYGFVALLEQALDECRPDVVLSYGGSWMGRAIISCARLRGLPVVFWLRNCSYADPRFFEPVTGALVPCAFSQNHYARLGIRAEAIPSPIEWARVKCEHVEPRYVTFVNPQPAKGLYVFARVAMELSRRRPDISLLVVEGRGGRQWLQQAGLPDLAQMPNLRIMPNTPDPRQFLSVSRMVLMPSVWQETFARIPVEAFINGIPVLASRRGGLPENLAEAGILLDVPSWCDEHSRRLPSEAEVEPWVKTIVRLWDDPSSYEAERQRCLAAARSFSETVLGERYDRYLRQIADGPHEALAGEPVTAMLRAHLANSGNR